jgi:hypothetical protein
MIEIGSDFFWFWFLEKSKQSYKMVHVKGLWSKQNIQLRIMSLILFNHSKSNVLRSKIQN